MRIILLLVIVLVACQPKTNTGNMDKTSDVVAVASDSEDKEFSSDQPVKKQSCHLPADDPAHFNPYYNGHLHENFDPAQTDFSKEFYELQTRKENNFYQEAGNLDFSAVWSELYERHGVIGLNYRTINMLFSRVKKTDQYTYALYGSSKVKENVCNFQGNLTIEFAHLYDDSDIPDITQGKVIGHYELKENASQKYSGVFRGTFESEFYFESDSVIKLDDLHMSADGYANNSFVGTWQEYKSAKLKKCIWGDGRLPFTFDYDIGAGELVINEKYREDQ